MLDYVTTHGSDYFMRWSFLGWNFNGANRDNTDHGRLYVTVTEDDDDTTVSIYRNEARTALIAEGTLNGANSGELTLVESNGSGITGTVRLNEATPGHAEIDVLYADDVDLAALQAGVEHFLNDGNFNGERGFKEPLARAKRVIEALMITHFPDGWRADSLQPLAAATARYALFFIYDHLSTRADDPAAQLAAHWRREARAALWRLRVSIAGRVVSPFDARILRA